MLLKVWKSTYQQQSSAWKPSAKEQFAQYWAWKLRYRSFVIETGCLCFRRLSSICATTHTRRWVFHIIFSISICLKSFSLSWKNLERKWKEVRKQICFDIFVYWPFFCFFTRSLILPHTEHEGSLKFLQIVYDEIAISLN